MSESLELIDDDATAPLGLDEVDDKYDDASVHSLAQSDARLTALNEISFATLDSSDRKRVPMDASASSKMAEKKYPSIGLVSGICQTRGNDVFTNSSMPYVHSATVPIASTPAEVASVSQVDFSESNRLSFPKSNPVRSQDSDAKLSSPPVKNSDPKRTDKTKIPSRFKVALAPDPLKAKPTQTEMTYLKEDIIHVLEKNSTENTQRFCADNAPERPRRAREPTYDRSVPSLSRKTSFDEEDELYSLDRSFGNNPNIKFPESPRTSPPKHLRHSSFIVEELDGYRANSPRPNPAYARNEEVPSMSKQLAVAEWAMRHAAERRHSNDSAREAFMSVSRHYGRYNICKFLAFWFNHKLYNLLQ